MILEKILILTEGTNTLPHNVDSKWTCEEFQPHRSQNLKSRNPKHIHCKLTFWPTLVHIVSPAWLFTRSISETIRWISIKFSIGGFLFGGRVYYIHQWKQYVSMRNLYSLPEHTVSTQISIWILRPKFRSTTPCHNIKRTAKQDIIALSQGTLAEFWAYHLNASD